MVKLISTTFALVLLALASPAWAGVAGIGQQFGFSAGFNPGVQGCTSIEWQCTPVPGKIVAWSGTETVKQPGAELLARVICNGTQIWAGEHYGQSTLLLQSPAVLPPNLTGPCWMEYEANSPVNTPPGGGWEMQFTIFYE